MRHVRLIKREVFPAIHRLTPACILPISSPIGEGMKAYGIGRAATGVLVAPLMQAVDRSQASHNSLRL